MQWEKGFITKSKGLATTDAMSTRNLVKTVMTLSVNRRHCSRFDAIDLIAWLVVGALIKIIQYCLSYKAHSWIKCFKMTHVFSKYTHEFLTLIKLISIDYELISCWKATRTVNGKPDHNKTNHFWNIKVTNNKLVTHSSQLTLNVCCIHILHISGQI